MIHKNIIGVDGGELGGIYISKQRTTIPMPLIRYTKKPSVHEVLKEKVKGKTKKQPILIKSGRNKDKAKTRKLINSTKDYYVDVQDLIGYAFAHADIVVLEKIGQTFGQNALKQTNNIEAVRIATRILKIDLVEVSAARWKKHFGLDDDKQKCINYANERSSLNFTPKQDGEAESYLIYLWFMEFYKSLKVGDKYNYTAKKIGKKYKAIKVQLLNINYLTASVKTSTGYEFDVRVEDLFNDL